MSVHNLKFSAAYYIIYNTHSTVWAPLIDSEELHRKLKFMGEGADENGVA